MSNETIERVASVKQSPLNALQWCLTLKCGHDVWVTAKRKPTRKKTLCERCHANLVAYHGDIDGDSNAF